ncbi:hypothetical protein AHF37_02159 [Paragonimus kellicotti]|nr:hypothetical protein AHF37_02159 [Paragonimus kellicotti]
MSETDEPSEVELTQTERNRIASNRDLAVQLRLSQVVANDRNVVAPVRSTNFHRTQLSKGGFIPDVEEKVVTPQFEKDEELTDDECDGQKRTKRRRAKRVACPVKDRLNVSPPSIDVCVPVAPDQEKPHCDMCDRSFDESFLCKNFDVYVCDRCRQPKGLHTLITKSTAKERYLLSDVDLDVREPKLRFLLKRNPHNSSWGDMRLYLEAQVAERALSIWGTEDQLEAERTRRVQRIETAKLKQYNKKIKELKVQTRSSLFMKTHATHQHNFGPETYDEANDVYMKRCTGCEYVTTFEKL